jgi:hypothetical protein
MTRKTRTTASSRVRTTSSMEMRTKGVVSKATTTFIPAGRVGLMLFT